MRAFIVCLLLGNVALGMESTSEVNPIRRVVNMLQLMQGKVVAEGKKAEALFDKYMCYCQNAENTLGASIKAAEQKIPKLEAFLKGGAAKMKQLEADIKKAEEDRAAAKEALKKAANLRKKEAAAFKAFMADSDENLAALGKAIPALEKGMAGFLQTSAASVLRQLSVDMDMSDANREALSSFLSGKSEYAPQSGQIVGILKQMEDEMNAEAKEKKAQEAAAIKVYKQLVKAKEAEIEAANNEIEDKSTRLGELKVKLAESVNDLEDTKEGLAEDKKFLANLDENCKKKEAEWKAYKQIQAEELTALADTIKVLNDDDALELFKKTLPSPSLLQMQTSSRAMRSQLSAVLRRSSDPRMDVVLMAMDSQKISFAKIIKMIDELVVELKKEQGADDDKKEYCEAQFDEAEDTLKELKVKKADTETVIENEEAEIAKLKEEIAALNKAIKALDKQVEEETEQRKEEHAENVATLATNANCVELLKFAKNRLNKFYNPKLYKPPPKRELSEEERIAQNLGETTTTTPAGGIAGTGIGLVQDTVKPPPPPKADLSYKKKGEESSGVIAMIDLMIADVEKENQELEFAEKTAQEDYEKFMADAKAKRAENTKAVTDKTKAKADTEGSLEDHQDDLAGLKKNILETVTVIGNLHKECDWLLQNYDARRAARTGEIDALGKAKDVLSGADYTA